MFAFYYYFVLLSAAVSVVTAGTVYYRNRFHAVGPMLCATMLVMAAWLFAFAQYFRPLPDEAALWWAKVTVSASILSTPLLFFSICALVEKSRQHRPWIILGFVLATILVGMTWEGLLVTGVKAVPHMHHYIHYDRRFYPLLGMYLTGWQLFGVGILAYEARRKTGYKQTQLIYFIAAWVIVFFTTSSIIIPLEYNINVQPFGFIILPFNLGFLAYVMAKARLADFNAVIAKALLHAFTLVVVVGVSLAFISAVTVLDPGFINPQQTVFVVLLVIVIGLALSTGLPRFMPQAERLMQDRMFGGRSRYQDTLTGLVKELSLTSNVDELLAQLATTIHSQMQLARVLILMQDPLSGQYRLSAESGLAVEESTDGFTLPDSAVVVQWLRTKRDSLVLDEIQRNAPAAELQQLTAELQSMKVVVCVPMIVDSDLAGVICLGEKVNRQMYFGGDLQVLETVGAEAALAVKYRRMEDQILRKNKLIELGTIAAGVAHEVRNPLASIRTFAQLLPTKMDDPEFTGEFSKLVLKDVDRITKVIESMLAFARPAQVTIGEHQAVELLEEAILLVHTRFKNKRLDLVKELHEDPTVRVDKQQILQVLVNLLSNAADALPERGRIRVATGIHTMNGNGAGSERYAVIEVADNGSGIPAPVLNRIFDPFFTTKKEGTGLGLSISQKIARDHGGLITVSSVEGKGTTFQVNLPVH